MSVRDKLRELLADCGLTEEIGGHYYADRILNEHAHELAEKQRAALAANPGLLEHELIDLIDPEKEGQ